jgi:DNA-cytosine methyltransferase
MNYLSVCSGIEAATVAWHHMGWKPVGFSEIEKFPSQVLEHHYPQVTNFGDMTKYKEWKLDDSIGLLVGGTPCQSFSVAGLRKGLEDPRGNLALTYVGILDHFKPKWFIWENVPGVLSSSGGRDFGSFLGAVAELGYGFAYRVLDAQYFGVAQRRKRVFVVGCFGDWQSAAKVLFEPESLRGDSPPSREKRKETAARTGVGVEISGPLSARDYKDAGTDGVNEYSAKMVPVGYTSNGFASYKEGVGTLKATSGDLGGGSETFVTDDATKYPTGIAEVCATITCELEKQVTNQMLSNQMLSNADSFFIPEFTDQVVYENHPSDSRVKEMGDVCSTVTSSWGTGGGNTPFVQAFNITFCDSNGTRKDRENGGLYVNARPDEMKFEDDLSGTMTKSQILGVLETYSIQGSMIGRSDEAGPQGNGINKDVSFTLSTTDRHAVAHPTVLMDQGGSVMNVMQDGTVGTLRSETHGHEPLVMDKSVAFDTYNHSVSDVNQTLKSPQGGVSESIGTVLSPPMMVRRLTPLECERLQGFPDNYTDIKPKGKPTSDGPRYKALGNSMAVPVMRWIGERINLIDKAQEK